MLKLFHEHNLTTSSIILRNFQLCKSNTPLIFEQNNGNIVISADSESTIQNEENFLTPGKFLLKQLCLHTPVITNVQPQIVSAVGGFCVSITGKI